MKITSHFVWIKLKSELLVDLYVALQKELGAYQTALEFQNILSVITYPIRFDICV